MLLTCIHPHIPVYQVSNVSEERNLERIFATGPAGFWNI